MVYDDEPYWFQKKSNQGKPVKIKEKPIQSSRYPDVAEVMARIEREPRQEQPDPLLVQWLEKKAKELPKD